MTLKREFSKRLKAARLKVGITQAELARRCAMTPEWINHLENARRLPDYETFFNLVAVLGCSADVFVVKRKKQTNNKRKERK